MKTIKGRKTGKMKPAVKKIFVAAFVLAVIICGTLGYLEFRKQVYHAKLVLAKSEMVSTDVEILDLQEKLTSYPPRISGDDERKTTTAKIEASVKKAQNNYQLLEANYQATVKDKAEVLWQIGELYRMEHNLDLKDAWQNSEKYLNMSKEVDPNYVKAYLSLGMLYVNSDLAKAHQAEIIFKQAKDIATEKEDILTVYSGLWFSYYYQFDLKDALSISEEAMNRFPDYEGFRNLHDITLKSLSR